MSKLAYLAGPVDQSHLMSAPWSAMRMRAENALNKAGFDVFRPYLAYAPGPCSAAIQRANDAVIDTARVGVVMLPAGVPTLGTPVEVERLLSQRKPVLIITDIEGGGSVQIESWRQRGAQVCVPSEFDSNLAQLRRRADEETPAQASLRQMGDSFRNMARQIASTTRTPELVFEPADNVDTVSTPTGPQHLLPTRGYSDDAGLDLYVAYDYKIGPHEFVDVASGVKMDIPSGFWAMITGRSSTLRKKGLLVNPGVIDAGWTGELFAGIQNMTDHTVEVSAGDRLAQLILLPAPVVGYEPVWGRVPEKERGVNGFGSTGR